MLVCLDYDGTYTEDPDMWDKFISLLKDNGHRVLCATMRYEHEGDEVKKRLGGFVEQIIFTGREAKMQYLDKMNIKPDVWIDDNPAFILMPSV